MNKIDNTEHEDERPPYLKSWKNLYIALVVNLIVLIILFYFFKEYFS